MPGNCGMRHGLPVLRPGDAGRAIKLEIAVRQVFPTLAAAAATPDTGPHNAELRERILARRAGAPSM